MKRLLFILLVGAVSCNPPSDQEAFVKHTSPYDNADFAAYWDQGKAELNNFDLEQCRYGEIRKGNAVLIFVTEDFSASKQVKLDDPKNAGNDAIHILKMNFTKKFITGIYPYSTMTSVFSPLNGYAAPLKITTSSQEWCGHTFTQLNKGFKGYKVQLNSYFESEGDNIQHIDKEILPEDAIWNMIRTMPDNLPKGKTELLPGTLYQRLSHSELKPATANCTLKEGDSVNTYTINYMESDRTLAIQYEHTFPYKITGWEETYKGIDGKLCTTKATLKKQIMLDYWKHNSLADSIYHDSLMLRD